MKILLYNPDNGVTRNFMPHLWMFLFGAPLRYDLHDVQNHNGILASNGAAHEPALNKLRPLLNEFGRFKVKGK